ncbi:hypothetical protein [Henriciella aquimarina]|uniref:hypothetical protein n=1 Tax=Henriciella aquimarina TaxID=545261 RepID=UPI001179908F|nr:hypothetical protein [Henriciella aquimarina]
MSKRAKRTSRKDADSLWPVGFCWSENVQMAVTLGVKFGAVIPMICVDRKLADGSVKQIACIELPPELVGPLVERLKEAGDVLNQLPGIETRSYRRQER